MQLTVNINQLIELIRQLPEKDFMRVRAELENKDVREISNREQFRQLLLRGPVMTDTEYQRYEENRKTMNAWRPR
jgi:hypothetical protein